MLHIEPEGARDASQSPSVPESIAADQQLPLAAADERPVDAALPRRADSMQQARDFLAAGETFAAATTLRALIAREPKNARAHAALAELLQQRGDLEGALAELGRAVDVAPDDVAILCARAALFTLRGKYDLAEADLRRAARTGEQEADVQLQLGVLFCKRARWREAVEPLRAAVASDPRRVASHYYLGEAYNSIDDLPAALGSYQAAAELDPSNHRALKAIGVVLDRMGRPVEAATAYQKAREAQRR
ncbi:MAG: tetratricopeptide repeat protein [Gemmatimonadales bacterium]